MDYTFEIRFIDGETPAGRQEREKYDIAGTDSAVLVSIGDEPVAWCDDYNTAHLIAGSEATPGKDDVEAFMRAAEDLWAASTGNTR